MKQYCLEVKEHGVSETDIAIIDLPPEIALELAESILKQYRIDRTARIRFTANAKLRED